MGAGYNLENELLSNLIHSVRVLQRSFLAKLL